MSIRPSLAIGAAVLATLAAGPALAQFGNPGFMQPGTTEAQPGLPAPGQPNASDRLFARLIAMGNTGEIEAAKSAQARASHPLVKAFARRMVDDHTATAARLAGAARPLDVALPTEPDPDQKAARARLESLQGAAFDAAYLQAQLVDHQKAVLLLQYEIGNGQEASLQTFAKETLPVVVEHLQHVQSLLAQVTGAGPQGLAARVELPSAPH